MSDAKFIEGLIVKAPNDKAPEYVKARLSIKREELIAWLQEQRGDWINADIKEAKSGKWYCAVDDWKPEGKGLDKPRTGNTSSGRAQRAPAATADDGGDDIPFITNRSTF
jgi:hypothetical protein